MSTNPFATGGTQATTPGAASPFTNGAAASTDATTAAAAALNNEAPQHAPEPLPDLEDFVTLASEQLTAKEGDAFAEPPPPPDRIYRCKLSLRGVKQTDMEGTDITKYLLAGADFAPWVPGVSKDKQFNITGYYAKTIINVQIADPRFPELEGNYLQIPFKWTDTRANKQGLSKIMTILNLAGNDPSGKPWIVKGQNYGHVDSSKSPLPGLMPIFLRFLAGEPEIFVRSEWSFNCEVCSKIGKQSGNYARSVDGMQKFPQVKPGVFNHEMKCPVNPAHGYSKARAMAVQYYSLADAVAAK